MKKLLALMFACSVLAGCTYLGSPEAYTVVDEETAPAAPAPAPVVTPSPCGGMYCAARPVIRTCGCGACQINPGVAGPLVVNVPGQPIVVQ